MKSRLIFFNWFVGMVVGSALGALLGGWGKLLIYGVPPQPIEEQPPGGTEFDFLWVGSNASLEDAKKAGPVFAWGNFMTEVINFLILAFIIFLMVKAINAMKRKEEEAPKAAPAPTKEELLLGEIRDILKSK
ncbi:MAG: large conductance mechanosensitive channel protein MscL, partial [Chryseobacterium sp.]